MNKLVSRNPVLRFKEGKKILKFSLAGKIKTSKSLEGTVVGDYTRKNTDYGLRWFDKKGNVLPFDSRKQFLYNGYNYSLNGNGSYSRGKILSTSSALPKGFLLTLDLGAELLNAIQEDEVLRARAAYDLLMGLKPYRRITKDSNRFISIYDKNGLWASNARAEGLTNRDLVKAFQLKLGLEGDAVDGIWGKNTQKAYDDWKLKLLSTPKTPFMEKNTKTIPLSEYTFTESQLQGLGDNPYFEPNPELRQFNRTQIRDFLRKNNINPYSMTGALRKALRMIMNGQGTELDKNLIGLTGGLGKLLTKYNYLKKGGNLLPSRNIVKRFKLQLGNKLPTAPKAEDRFKNGVKDSVAYLGVPGKDNSYFGETIKRVTTPDNAAILRQILFRHYPHDNDTIYTEVPEHTKRLSIFPQVNIIPRKGFSFAQTPEYEILKRRFNTAWNLAK